MNDTTQRCRALLRSLLRLVLLFLLCAAHLCLTEAAPMFAQQPLEEGSIQDTVDVSIVNLDVYVTDKKGAPVTNLTQGDFRVLEDGKEVEITNFLPVETLPSGEMAAGEALVEPLHLIVYLDNTLMLPNDRQRVLTDLRTFLERSFPSETRFMLASLGTSLEVVVPYTTEPDHVRSALANLEKDASGIGTETDRARAESNIQSIYEACESTPRCSPCSDVWQEMVQSARTYATDVDRRVSNATDNLFRFIGALGGLPGRKALLYLSSGMEQRPGEDVFYSLVEPRYCPERLTEINQFLGDHDKTSLLYALAAHANANRVTFYNLDTGGARSSDGGRQDTTRIGNLRNSLYLLGNETGGDSIFNSSRSLPRLESMIQDLGNYYSIAYRPIYRLEPRATGGSAQSHLIDVELVSKKKLDVRYRRTMRPKSVQERLAERLMAALLLGAEDNPLEVEVVIDQPEPEGDELFRVPVRVMIPASALLSIADGTNTDSRVRIFMTARDRENRGTEVRQMVLELGDDPAQLSTGNVLSYVIHLELEPGEYQVAVGIRDEIARTASYLRRPVTIPKLER